MALDVAFRDSSPLWIVCHFQRHCQAKQRDGLLRYLLRFCHHPWCQGEQHRPGLSPGPSEPGFLIHWPQLGAEMQSLRQRGRGEKPRSVCNVHVNCNVYCCAKGSLQSQNMNIGHGPSLACIIIRVVPRGILLPVMYLSFCKLSHIPLRKEGHAYVLV